MNFYFDWRPDSVYATLQSHVWYIEKCVWSGFNRTDWHGCNPVCGCEHMTLDDIAYLLPHHQTVPPRGYVINFPVDPSVQNPAHLRRFVHPQPNSLSNIAGAIIQQQLRNFFSRANYPFRHYNDFVHAQMVLKTDYNVPLQISYYLLPPLDYRMCWCDVGVNIVVTSPYEPRIHRQPRNVSSPLRDSGNVYADVIDRFA